MPVSIFLRDSDGETERKSRKRPYKIKKFPDSDVPLNDDEVAASCSVCRPSGGRNGMAGGGRGGIARFGLCRGQGLTTQASWQVGCE